MAMPPKPKDSQRFDYSLLLNGLKESAKDLPPAYFAMIMATGIVSIAAHLLGMSFVAVALFWLNIIAYLVLWFLNVLRVIWFTRQFFSDMVDHRRGPGFFTSIARSCVLGSQFVLISGNYRTATFLWVARNHPLDRSDTMRGDFSQNCYHMSDGSHIVINLRKEKSPCIMLELICIKRQPGFIVLIPRPFTLAVEATYDWYFFVDLAEPYAQKVFLTNSYELKAFAKRHKKTDKINAWLIAHILQKGFLPVVAIADQQTRQTRQIRELLRYQLNLVTDRSRNIFRRKALLDKLGMNSHHDFTTYKGLRNIVTGKVPEIYTRLVKNYIDRITELEQKLTSIEKEIGTVSSLDHDRVNLMSIPGIGHFSAALIKSEIIDISRFASCNRLCAYAGLAPRISASANRTFRGPLNINRRKNLQWILLENVYHFIRAIPEMKERYGKLKQRKGHNTAKVVLARDMLKIIFPVLKERRPFYTDKEEYQIQSVAAPALCGV